MKKALRIIGVVAIVGILIAAIVTSMTHKTPNSEKIWDKDMTIGNIDAENYFIVYSDIACPYCVAFENAIIEHEEEFKEYIEKNDILMEIRLSDFLYEYGESNPIESFYGAEAIFCAKNEGKFWEYYNLAIKRVWSEYFGVSGKAAFTEFNKLKRDYWIDMGKEVGLGDEFATCVNSNQMQEVISKNAAKTAKIANGLPAFKFNNYEPGGFDLSWGWDYVLMYFDTGLKSR